MLLELVAFLPALLPAMPQDPDLRPAIDRAPPAIEPRREDLARWRAHVRPSADELAFEAIPWIPSFAAGLERAASEQKPLLFWAMNGHPLGCT